MVNGSQFKLLPTVLCAVCCTVYVSAINAKPGGPAGNSQPQGYSPAAPHGAIHGAISSNLKIVQGWLDNSDFTSAAETTDGLILLANIYQSYSDEPSWKEKAAALSAAFQKLMAQARSKDAAACEKASQACAKLLDEFAGQQPIGAKASSATRPSGTFRTVMKLMDGCYADAKGTKSASERANFLYTIAECSNLTASMRNEADWHQRSTELRDEAIRLAAAKPSSDLQEVKRELKNVYERCESCHKAFKR